MCAHNVFFLNFYSFGSFMTVKLFYEEFVFLPHTQ